MRKILIAILLILLIVLAYFTIFEGISIGSFKVLNTAEIISMNDSLNSKIEEANRKIKIDLQEKKESLQNEINKLNQSKEEYFKQANTSTDSEIEKANTEEIYDMEFLWLRVGRYARTKGVNIEMVPTSTNTGETEITNLSFTVVGQYIGIMNFISAIEDDSELLFRIENFDLVSDSGDNLKATFNVNGLNIKKEEVTTEITTTQTTTDGQTNNDITTTTGGNTTNTVAQ